MLEAEAGKIQVAWRLTGDKQVPDAARDGAQLVRGFVAALALAVVGCGSFTAPTPTAGTMDDVIAGLVLRGITIHRLVSGDPGCPSSDLQSNAVRLEVSIGDRSATHDVYLMRWRGASDFADSAQPFSDCVVEYQALNPGQTVNQLESQPWRAYGPGWPPDLGQTIVDALHAAGGG